MLPLASSMSIIRRQGGPTAPEGVQISVPTPTSVSMTWDRLPTAPEGLQRTNIIVYIRDYNEKLYTESIPPDSTEYSRNDLSPRTWHETWLCAVYEPGVGEICTGYFPFATAPEEPGNPIPFIGNIQANGPYSISVEILGGSSGYSYYAVVIESDSGYTSNTSFDNADRVDHMTVQVNDLPPGTTFTVWLEGCQSVVVNICSGPGPKKTVETPCIDNACLYPYVWREATPGDIVCVTTQVRSDVRSDNEQADSRVEPEGGAYGPDTCKQGFVWREATPNDHVCVTPQTRDLMNELNGSAHERVNPKCVV